MKKILILSAIFALFLVIACGGGGETGATMAKGEARVVAEFLDDIAKKGDLNSAFNLLIGEEKAILGEMPGFYDFLTGKEDETVAEEMIYMRTLIQEITPIPTNVLSYKIGDPVGEGDTMTVPVTFSYPKEDFEQFVKDNMDKDLFDRMDNLDKEDMPLSEKKALIKKAMNEFRRVVKGKTFEMDSMTQEVTIIKNEGKWKISLFSTGLMNMFGGGGF